MEQIPSDPSYTKHKKSFINYLFSSIILTCKFLPSEWPKAAALLSEEANDAESGEECALKPVAILVLSVNVGITS